MDREVLERDLRAPEFREGEPSDYERRDDGKIVRKDRWERGLRSVSFLLFGGGGFEIDDVVEGVRKLVTQGPPPRTDQEIVDQTEELAARLANADGYVYDGGLFHRSDNPRAHKAWRMACMAQEDLTQTDVNNAVANLQD